MPRQESGWPRGPWRSPPGGSHGLPRASLLACSRREAPRRRRRSVRGPPGRQPSSWSYANRNASWRRAIASGGGGPFSAFGQRRILRIIALLNPEMAGGVIRVHGCEFAVHGPDLWYGGGGCAYRARTKSQVRGAQSQDRGDQIQLRASGMQDRVWESHVTTRENRRRMRRVRSTARANTSDRDTPS